MLEITIGGNELWDEKKEEFTYTKEYTLSLEHSLISISKWEAKWNKSFLMTKNFTDEEILDYIKCMTLTNNVSPKVYDKLSNKNIEDIFDYINAPMTATTFNENNKRGSNREIITSELIYCWMIMLNIPYEYQKWHLNRLLTLIRVCDIKNQPPKKMGKRECINQYAKLNAARRKQLNSKG